MATRHEEKEDTKRSKSSDDVTGRPTCPYHGKELGLANGGLRCPMSGCHHHAEIGAATHREDHGFRPLSELQKELTMEDVNADLKHAGREPNLGEDGEPVLEEVGARQSEENARGVPRIVEGPDGSQDKDAAEIKTEKTEHERSGSEHKKHSR